ncbi:MAG: glycosyltransferase family 4 protein [Cytophagales bacterium]|nr:glycosyltransferase family 4 protein [Armatimonadota bacterium]
MNLGFALEYSLGHRTHAQNLKTALSSRPTEIRLAGIKPTYVDVSFDGMKGAWTRLPGIRSNWSLRASLGAFLGLRPHTRRLDGALFHTQVTSLLSSGFMRRVPSVISLDATPIQYDALGAFYGHAPSGNARLEALKKALNNRAFEAARSLVTWSEWAKASLIDDYGIPPEKVVVIPPGIDIARWGQVGDSGRKAGAPVRLLFVGGDFERKGGSLLLRAWKMLPAALRRSAELHIVTKTWTESQEQERRQESPEDFATVFVHRGLQPNSAELRDLYRNADLFVFPTQGDCLPLAVLEAMASGLPVITTSVGALPEAVQHGQAGWVIPVDDCTSLTSAIEALVSDEALRRTLGKQAGETARARFDAKRNYPALMEVVTQAASSPVHQHH